MKRVPNCTAGIVRGPGNPGYLGNIGRFNGKKWYGVRSRRAQIMSGKEFYQMGKSKLAPNH